MELPGYWECRCRCCYLVVAHTCGVTNRKARLKMAMDEAELALSGRPRTLSNKLKSSAGLLRADQMLAARSECLTVQRRLARRRRLLEKYPWRRLLLPDEPRIHLLVLVHHLLDTESLFEVGAALFARQSLDLMYRGHHLVDSIGDKA